MKNKYIAPVMTKVVVIEKEDLLVVKSGVYSVENNVDINWGGFDEEDHEPD